MNKEEQDSEPKIMYRDEHGNLYRPDERKFEWLIKEEEKDQYEDYHLRNGKYYTFDYDGFTKVEVSYRDVK